MTATPEHCPGCPLALSGETRTLFARVAKLEAVAEAAREYYAGGGIVDGWTLGAALAALEQLSGNPGELTP